MICAALRALVTRLTQPPAEVMAAARTAQAFTTTTTNGNRS